MQCRETGRKEDKMSETNYRYRRVLLKLSGEAISGKDGIINFEFLDKIASTLCRLSSDGVQIGIVFGAGNIWRGRSSGDMDRVTADRMGMLATVINSLACKDAIIRAGGRAVCMSATPMEPVCEYYRTDKAISALESGNIVIFAGGTGSPYFSTDTAGILRAIEIKADALLLAKNVDGIYDSDPVKNPEAKRYDTLSYSEILSKNLKAIDLSAAAMGSDFGPEAFAFRLADTDDIIRACRGECAGTVITK